MKWKDISSWARGEERGEPKSIEAMAGGVRIVVTRHLYHPGEWTFSAPPWFDVRLLGDIPLERAKEKAVAMLRDVLSEALAATEGKRVGDEGREG